MLVKSIKYVCQCLIKVTYKLNDNNNNLFNFFKYLKVKIKFLICKHVTNLVKTIIIINYTKQSADKETKNWLFLPSPKSSCVSVSIVYISDFCMRPSINTMLSSFKPQVTLLTIL